MTSLIDIVNAFPRGVHHVEVTRRDGSTYEGLVMVQAKDRAFLMPKPTESDMYSSWTPITRAGLGVKKIAGQVYVWAARDPEFMKQFDGVKYSIDFREIPR